MLERSAPVRVSTPTSRPPSTTGVNRRRVAWRCSNASAMEPSTETSRTVGWVVITWSTWVNWSTPWQSPAATTPTGRPAWSTTTAAPWARLSMRVIAVWTVSVGATVTAVSTTGWRVFTQATTSRTTSSGMSWGRIASPPRRATVSAIRRPLTAVMLATTTGMVAPVASSGARSTSNRLATSDGDGTRKTSPYVRSWDAW